MLAQATIRQSTQSFAVLANPGTLASEDNATLPGTLEPRSVRVRVSCTACGREFRATPEPGGSLSAIPETGGCDCGAALTPHFTEPQLDQMHRLREENPDAAY